MVPILNFACACHNFRMLSSVVLKVCTLIDSQHIQAPFHTFVHDNLSMTSLIQLSACVVMNCHQNKGFF
jgi:hypothetical protein